MEKNAANQGQRRDSSGDVEEVVVPLTAVAADEHATGTERVRAFAGQVPAELAARLASASAFTQADLS